MWDVLGCWPPEEQLNPSSSEILDDPSCVSRVATPIISRRGDEKKKGEGKRITNETKNHVVSWDHHRRHVGCVLGFLGVTTMTTVSVNAERS